MVAFKRYKRFLKAQDSIFDEFVYQQVLDKFFDGELDDRTVEIVKK